jgi:hypothetical protein
LGGVAPTLIVQPAEIARRLGVSQPLEEDDRWLLEAALIDAQSDLEAYLGRAVVPRTYVDEHVQRYVGPGADDWRLANWPVVSIAEVTEEEDTDGSPTGLWRVTYVAGLDGAADPELEPLRRYVRVHAIYSPGVQAWYRRTAPDLARTVTSVSVEGQSVSWSDNFPPPLPGQMAGKEAGQTAPGSLPTLASCDRWRIAGRRVFQRTTPPPRWPYRDWAYEWPYNGGLY